MSARPRDALFVTSASSMSPLSGGQQLCTREYRQVLKAAGFCLSVTTYNPDRRLQVRIRRKIWPRPYRDQLPPELVHKIVAEARTKNLEEIFLNVVDSAPLAWPIRKELGSQCRIVLLSHGLASVDYLHELRARDAGAGFAHVGARDLRKLSMQFVEECLQRQAIDHVFCLAPFEVEIERWLGAKGISWLPRLIPQHSLKWKPQPGRLGFVGTVDHPPNYEGLALFLDALEKIATPDVKLRLVGGPPAAATKIASRFPAVEYLGTLSDDALEAEASTWNCFVHPLFCYARGCSTKLAVALSWQIPVVTTDAGCRGYAWHEGILPLAQTPEGLARLALEMLNSDAAQNARRNVIAITQSSPTIRDIADQINVALFEQTTTRSTARSVNRSSEASTVSWAP